MTYPIKKLPIKVEKYLQGELVDLENIILPSKPVLERYDYSGYLLAVGLMLLLTLLAFLKVTYWLIYPAIVFFAYWSFSSSLLANKKTKWVNIKLKKDYLENFNSISSENEHRNSKKKDLQRTQSSQIYIKEKIKEELRNYTPPLPISWQTKKGFSESYFIRFLFLYFKDNIKPFRRLYSSLSDAKDYQPDFIFQNEKICIDIEIDEPYSIDGRIPIHLAEENTDNLRDIFFIENNWCVIRFSEEQSLLHPYECCKYIASLIQDLTGDDTFLLNLHDRGILPPINRYTRVDAERKSIQKYRELLFSKAKQHASQTEIFPSNYFTDSIILITKINEWEDYHLCLNNNFNGPQNKIACKKTLFPSFSFGQTIELDLNLFTLENIYIDRYLPIFTNPDNLYSDMEEYKETIVKIDSLKAT